MRYYLYHLCYFEGSDILVNVEVLFLDKEDVGGCQHVWQPVSLNSDLIILSLLDDDKPEVVVICEGIDKLVIPFPLQF